MPASRTAPVTRRGSVSPTLLGAIDSRATRRCRLLGIGFVQPLVRARRITIRESPPHPTELSQMRTTCTVSIGAQDELRKYTQYTLIAHLVLIYLSMISFGVSSTKDVYIKA